MSMRRRLRLILGVTAFAWHAVSAAQTVGIDGEAVFRHRCAVCHGVRADGRSDLARIMRPPPANLRASTLSEAEQSAIVRLGGAAVGRSSSMPEWRGELTEAELVAVLAYIRSVKESIQ